MSNLLFKMHCPNCGARISDSDPVCPSCGLDLDAPLGEGERRALAQASLEKARKTLDSGRRLKEALADCNQAIEFTPESAEAHNLRGLILDAMGKTGKSIEAYREAVRLDPDLADAKENLADAESDYQGERTRIDNLFEKLIVSLTVTGRVVGIAVLLIALYVVGKPYLTPKRAVIFEPDRSKITTVTPADLKKTAEILTQRWHALGYDAPLVSFFVSDNGQIVGQIPSDIDTEFINRTKALGLVEFVAFGKQPIPPGIKVNTDFTSGFFPKIPGTIWITIMTNREIQGVFVQPDGVGGYEIAFTLTNKGKQIFADYTGQHVGTYLGITVDKVVVSCPQINGAIPGGQGVIQGNFTQATAEQLAAYLKSIPLPVPLK